MKLIPLLVVSVSTGILAPSLPLSIVKPALSLPPPEETPEEVLRTEIITEARSPVNGLPLTASEYAELQAQLQTRPYPPQLNPKVRQNIFLLRFRKLIRTFLPFLPI